MPSDIGNPWLSHSQLSLQQRQQRALAANYSGGVRTGPGTGSVTGQTREEFEAMLTPEFLSAMEQRMKGTYEGERSALDAMWGLGPSFEERMQGPLGRLYGASPDRKPWEGSVEDVKMKDRIAALLNPLSASKRAALYKERQKVGTLSGRVDEYLKEGGAKAPEGSANPWQQYYHGGRPGSQGTFESAPPGAALSTSGGWTPMDVISGLFKKR